MSKGEKREPSAIETLASAELEDWFVWDLLVTTALEKTGHDRIAAIRLLAQAIAKLALHDTAAQPYPGSTD